MNARILIVDDDPDILSNLEKRIRWMGHEPITTDNGHDAVRLCSEETPDLVLLDLELPGLSGIEVLKRFATSSTSSKSGQPQRTGKIEHPPVVIVLTAFGSIERAVEAMQLGAFDFLTKPFKADHLAVVIEKALSTLVLHRQVEVLRGELEGRYDNMIGSSAKMDAVTHIAKQAANSLATVLLQGETGTGKEVFAHAIHRWSPRAQKPFIAVNCAALPESLLENELFGHEKGAFTGAIKREAGKLETAEGGTVFFDEIGDMPLLLQSRLLRVLQDQRFYRIGGNSEVRADVRFIAATNKDLRDAVQQKTFREDLYFRLTVVTITLPPLRERMDDIAALAAHFLTRAPYLGQRRQFTLSPSAMHVLEEYPWPGNVRELENVLARATILCPQDIIEPEHLQLGASALGVHKQETPSLSHNYHDSMELYSCKLIEEALRRNDGNQTKAADALGLQRTYLTKLLRQKGIRSRTTREEDRYPR
jgi:DNA-binding NtrC family response regulator